MALSVNGSRWDGWTIVFALFGIFLSAIFLTTVPWAIALMLPTALVIVLLIGLVVLLTPSGKAQSLLIWTLASFALHLIVGAFIMNTDLVSYLGPDALDYDADAQNLVSHWRGSDMEADFSSSKAGFYYLLGGLYWLLGSHPISGLVINAACAAALIPIVFFTTTRLFGERPARWVAPLLTLTPSFLIWPAQLLREAPILLLIGIAAASAVTLTSSVRALPILALALALLVMFTFRGSVALLMAAGLLIGTSLGLRRLWVGISLQTAVLTVMAILILGLGFGYSGFTLATQVDLQDVQAFRSATAEDAGSSFQTGDVSSLQGSLTALPIGAARVLFGPFPWEIGPRQAPAIVDGAVMWALLPALLIGLRQGWLSCGRRLLVLWIPATLLLALLSLVIGNYGLLLRERTQMMVLLIPIVSLGLEGIAERRKASRQVAGPSTVNSV